MTKPKPKRAVQLGVSDDEYARLLAVQGGGCAICGSEPKTRRLHVDHDHKTGKVRGLLCFRCNRALPTYVDRTWLAIAAVYVGVGAWASKAGRERGIDVYVVNP